MPAQTVIKLRRDTAANWDSVNPVLASGEMGVETDTGLHKFGNGTANWGALSYAAATRVVQQVKNATGSNIAKGAVVYISGATGGDALISLADADSEATSSKTLGFTSQAISNGAYGTVIEAGLLSGVNTASATAGQSVWLSSTAGGFVFNAPPAKPAHSVYLGVVTRAHATEGEILVKVQNGYELNELHDVNAASPSTNDVLQWNGTAWVNANVISQVTSAIVDSAPSALDTLNELAAALGDDANFASTVTTALGNKQDKVSGVSDTEIGYLDGVTSAIQTQLNGKAASSHTHAISDITNLQNTLDAKQGVVSGVSNTEISYLDGVTSAIQTQLDGKQAVVSGVSSTEISYLDGVTSAIQTQLDGKAATSHTHTISNVTNLQASLDAKADLANPSFTGVVSGNASASSTAANGANAIGFKGIPASAAGASGNYTLVAADAGEMVYTTTSRTVTIPANASVPFEIGTSVVFVSGAGATTTIAITSDTLLLAGPGTSGTRTLAAHGIATAVKVAATTWYISGNGLT